MVMRSVDQALEATFGVPERVPEGVELRTDHGSQYTGHGCASLLGRWGVAHTFSPVVRPTGNAVAERLIRTLEEVIWRQDREDGNEVERAVARVGHPRQRTASAHGAGLEDACGAPRRPLARGGASGGVSERDTRDNDTHFPRRGVS